MCVVVIGDYAGRNVNAAGESTAKKRAMMSHHQSMKSMVQQASHQPSRSITTARTRQTHTYEYMQLHAATCIQARRTRCLLSPQRTADRLTNERDEKRTKERKRVILLVSNQLQHERVRVNSE